MHRSFTVFAVTASLCGCESGGTSTREIEAAAVQRARQQLRLPASAPLEAKVWVGSEEFDDQPVLCGTVSGAGSSKGRVRPQRFAATGDPINWLVFEDAHAPIVRSQPDKFQEWGRLCSDGPAAAAPTTQNDTCGTRMDANQNGKLEEAEYNSFGFAFDNWDTNDDYTVSHDEFGRCWEKMRFSAPLGRGFTLFDADASGSLSQEEFFAPKRFEQFSQLPK